MTSITEAMYSGSSALTNYGNAMTVIGNNLANANTTAFKGSRTTFEDILIQTVGISGTRGATQIGTGMGMSSVDQNMSQGTMNSTTSVTDMSIDGRGFFEVKSNPNVSVPSAGGSTAVTTTGTYYTRAGDFKQNNDGLLVNNGGLVLQGWVLDASGNKGGNLQDINMSPFKTSNPKATTSVNVGVNLNATTPANTKTYNPDDPATYDYATTTRVYDSLGNGHNVQLQFRSLGNNAWEWHVAVPASELDPKDPAQSGAGTTMKAVDLGSGNVTAAPSGVSYTAGKLEFDSFGRLSKEGSTPIQFAFTGIGGTPSTQQILFDFGGATDANGDSTNDFTPPAAAAATAGTGTAGTTGTTTGTTGTTTGTTGTTTGTAAALTYGTGTAAADSGNSGTNGTVQMAGDSSTLKLSQNGFPVGYLENLAIGQDGKITGNYSNGDSRGLYQIALVDFDNSQALSQIGSNLFAETRLSGAARADAPQSGRLGSIKNFSLEQSNIDLSSEFINMIAVQRAFQANSRVVTISDGMLEELVSLKR
ncbi:MAG: flagellar hook protein FlgE [Magnetococcales bacterium]|nr:flagellar hook protein FlgE [Magnetococcales bacterium]